MSFLWFICGKNLIMEFVCSSVKVMFWGSPCFVTIYVLDVLDVLVFPHPFPTIIRDEYEIVI